MKTFIVISILFLKLAFANADMVSNDSIGNDPAKEKLCASRAKHVGGGKAEPFEIDSNYVARIRSLYPDATFIVKSGQLVQCHLREGTGRFEPDSYEPEGIHWHAIRPKGFEPGINTAKGQSMAANVCLQAALSKSNRPGLDHSVNNRVVEVQNDPTGRPYHHGTRALFTHALATGKKAERYDIIVEGTCFYKPANPDLTAVKFSCLLSPSLEVKAIQFK
jgi:hypothetical protein